MEFGFSSINYSITVGLIRGGLNKLPVYHHCGIFDAFCVLHTLAKDI